MSGLTVERLKAAGIESVGVELNFGGGVPLDLAWYVALTGEAPTAEDINNMIRGGLTTRTAPPSSIRIYVKGPNGEPCMSLLDVFDIREDGDYAPEILKQLEIRLEEYESLMSIDFQADRLGELGEVQEHDPFAEAVWDLLDQAADLAIKCLKKKVPFSLVGYSLREDGEVITHHITAQDDQEMYMKAIKALALGPTVGFALIGEGKVGPTKEQAVSSLICYVDYPALDCTTVLSRPYKRTFLGDVKVVGDGYMLFRELDMSWLELSRRPQASG